MAITLTKGQKISLAKESGSGLTKVIMGLGWDMVKKKQGFLGGLFGSKEEVASIDLDASCVMFGDGKNVLDTVWFRQLKSRDGSIVHTGDNLTGAGDGDDEQIIVDLSKVPANVHSLVFTVSSWTGQTFSQVENAYCRMVDAASNGEIARYNLSGVGSHTAQIMARVYRHGGEWKMHAIGANAHGSKVEDLVPHIVPHL